MTEHSQDTRVHGDVEDPRQVPEEHAATLAWLEEEFPEWDFEVGQTSTPSQGERSWWVARKVGHHPQSELSAGRLYSRLSEYLARQGQCGSAEDN